MFGLGLFEIILIFIIALLVIKPEDLPKLLRSVGQIYGQLRRLYWSFIQEIEMHDDEQKNNK